MPEFIGPNGGISWERDEWGTPRFEVRDLDEAAFARGYFHAVDRLVQTQITMAAGRGQLMSILGDQPLSRWVDRSARTLGLAVGLDEQAAALDSEAARTVQAYCDGFNQGMRTRGRPFITRIMGVTPKPLLPRDVVLVYRTTCWFGLTSLTVAGKVATAQLLAKGENDALMDLLLGPGAEGLNRAALEGLAWPEEHALPGLAPAAGSNAFAVAGRKSVTGSAILMSEFHMEIGRLPAVIHMSHAQLPDGYVQGVSVPGLPLVSAGRNKRAGWGLTFGHADHIDVTVQRYRNGERQVGETWLPLKQRTETVEIRGAPSEEWTFLDFDGGTLLGDDARGEGRAFGVGWRGLKESYSDLSAALGWARASSVDELVTSLSKFSAVSIAAVFADDAGRIAWGHTGRVPMKRSGWGPRAGWDLETDPDVEEVKRPTRVDPKEGFVVSANERTDGWTAYPEARYRHERITEQLAEKDRVDAEDLLRISYDEHDACAARLLPVWRDHLPSDADGRMLAAWSGAGGHRREMGLFHALHHELTHHVVAEHIGEEASLAMWDQLNLIVQFQDRIDDTLALETEHLDADGLQRAIDQRWPAALKRAQRGAMAGPVTSAHKNVITRGKLPAFLGFSTREAALPGGPTSPFATRRNSILGETLTSGPAFHLLIDMGEEGLRYNLAGGGSERRFGPGYSAGVEAWLKGDLKRLR